MYIISYTSIFEIFASSCPDSRADGMVTDVSNVLRVGKLVSLTCRASIARAVPKISQHTF